MGRWNALEDLGLLPEDLVDLYNQTTDIKQLSSDLEVSVKTLKKHLTHAGLRPPWKYPPRKNKRHSGEMAHWIRTHPHIRLPPSVPEMTAITGLSRFAIHQYLYRRQDAYMKYVKENWPVFLHMHQKNFIFHMGDRVIPIHALRKTYLTIDKFSLKIRVRFLLKDGLCKAFSVSPDYYNNIIRQQKQEDL